MSRTTLSPGLRRSLLQQIPFVVVVGLFVGSGLVTGLVLEVPGFADIGVLSPRLLAALVLYMPLLVLYHATRVTFWEKERVFSRRTWQVFAREQFTLTRLLPTFLILILLGPLMSTFVTYKGLIPMISPFSWDPTFMQLDSWVHGGTHPWELLFPMFGSPAMIRFLDSVYVLWFPAVVMTLVWQAWSGTDPLRSQFFLTYALTWIVLGVGMAIGLSSAGPCYYLDVVGAPSTYDGLMTHLGSVDRAKPLAALHIQDILWTEYVSMAEHKIEGISAMPSLHVAMATLLVLLYSRVHVWAGAAAGAFAVLILVGSIMLGWHYAIDGYVGAALVIPLWWIAGRVQAALMTSDAA